jgi:hypothetical protein
MKASARLPGWVWTDCCFSAGTPKAAAYFPGKAFSAAWPGKLSPKQFFLFSGT